MELNQMNDRSYRSMSDSELKHHYHNLDKRPKDLENRLQHLLTNPTNVDLLEILKDPKYIQGLQTMIDLKNKSETGITQEMLYRGFIKKD